MVNRSVKHFISNIDFDIRLLKKQGSYPKFLYNVLNRYQSQWSKSEKAENDGLKELKETSRGHLRPQAEKTGHHTRVTRYSSDEEDFGSNKWKPDLAWLSKALEPALQLYKWALPAGSGNGIGDKPPPTDRTLSEIFASIQRSKIGLQDWSLSDLTIGLYLIYLQQASKNPVQDVKGELISSDSIVKDFIYHTELAKGAYRDSAAGLARHSMLRESNVVKFVKNSSVLRPGYYIGVDARKRLVILGIRGTHTVYDLITDIVSSSTEEMTYEGYSTHYGTAEAARWFLNHEMDTIRRCLNKHEGFRLRLVGHSLGAAIASLLAVMLRKKSFKELGFNPDIVSAVGYATPPCVSRDLAESCSGFVTTIVMQDDIVPRLSVASLTRLRNEILQTDWASVLEKEDWKGVVDLVTNAKQVVSSVQDVARKLANYAKFRGQRSLPDVAIREDAPVVASLTPGPVSTNPVLDRKGEESASSLAEELFVPGSLYYLKRNVDTQSTNKAVEYFTLWKRHPGEHFQRIMLSSNLISDHKCDSHYYALRDVLKGLPISHDEGICR